ncbi:MAG: NAD-dependent epimerase/dehydratase family protein [Methanobacteriota archaeon]
MQGRRVLVTGGAGFIGSHLVERLSARNTVAVLDDLSTGSIRNLQDAHEEVHVHKGSVLQPADVAAAMKGAEVAYHLAAKTSVAESVEKPEAYWRANVEGTLNVLKAAVDAGVGRFVFVSSAAVYGNVEANPKVETMRPAPASPYATTKMVGEFACEEVSQLKGLETVVLRIFNAYGPRQDPTSSYAGVIARFCDAIAADRALEIFGDGEQTRDFLYVADAAEALELAADRPVAGQTFNVGSGAAISVNDVARALSDITVTPVKAVRKDARAGDVRHSRADMEKAIDVLGFAPRTSLREGLERTLAYFRTKPGTASLPPT